MVMTNPSKKPETQGCLQVCLIGCGAVIFLFATIGLIGFISSSQEQSLKPEEKQQQEAEKQNEWYKENSHYLCEEHLKEQLRDPDSYKRNGDFSIIEDNGNEKGITWNFRAKNGFGGYNVSTGVCKIKKKTMWVSATSVNQ
jgi:hypothetical protein